MSSTRSPQKPGAGGSVPPSVPAPIAIPAGGGGLPSAPSSNHVSTPGTHENLIGQLQERLVHEANVLMIIEKFSDKDLCGK